MHDSSHRLITGFTDDDLEETRNVVTAFHLHSDMRSRPLSGKTVVMTRAARQSADFAALLSAHGAVPLHYPCIAIAPPEDSAPFDELLRMLASAANYFDWLVLTSANTVTALVERLEVLDLPQHALTGLKIAAVGPATADALRELAGLQVELVPDAHQAAALAESLPILPGERALIPQGDIALPILAQTLAARGADVTVVTAYRTVAGSGGSDIPRLAAAGRIDAITFTSPSTVSNFVQRFTREGGDLRDLRDIYIACIGPSTLRAALDHGFIRAVAPSTYTLDGLIQRLESDL